jgi:hypothetical protein
MFGNISYEEYSRIRQACGEKMLRLAYTWGGIKMT